MVLETKTKNKEGGLQNRLFVFFYAQYHLKKIYGLEQVPFPENIRIDLEVNSMKKPGKYLEKISEKLLLPRQIIAGLPQIEINGFSELSVDLQQGLLEYSNSRICVAVKCGTVAVEGEGLYIRLMREGRISIVGTIKSVILQGEKS